MYISGGSSSVQKEAGVRGAHNRTLYFIKSKFFSIVNLNINEFSFVVSYSVGVGLVPETCKSIDNLSNVIGKKYPFLYDK